MKTSQPKIKRMKKHIPYKVISTKKPERVVLPMEQFFTTEDPLMCDEDDTTEDQMTEATPLMSTEMPQHVVLPAYKSTKGKHGPSQQSSKEAHREWK